MSSRRLLGGGGPSGPQRSGGAAPVPTRTGDGEAGPGDEVAAPAKRGEFFGREALRRRNLRTLAVLLAIPVGMALFALFAFRPLYTLWCNATGTGMRPNATVVGVGDGREVEVLFRSRVFDGLPLRFAPDQARQVVRIGEDAHAIYRLENTSDRTLRIRPIHQVSPINAARHFGMKVCFCFNDQDIEPHGTREFPVIYAFAPALDRRIETVTLCYSLFDVAPGAARSTDMERIEREVREYGEIVSPRRSDARP